MNSISVTCRLEDEFGKWEVSGKVLPGDPGVTTFSNGDPGYSGTGPEAIPDKITLNGKEIEWDTISEKCWHKILEAMIEESEKQ